MKKNTTPIVSVIITTKNEETNIESCLTSIKKQTYKNKEVIVVDNNSSDKTKEIAEKFTSLVFNKGPERSTQKNFGSKKARGKYILFLDADMLLTPHVIERCVAKMESTAHCVAVVIPEKSFGEGFWAQCKALERSFYIGKEDIESSRFLKKQAFLAVGGYDNALISAEDWDLEGKIKNKGKIERVTVYIRHNEGKLSLKKTIQKKFYYAQHYSTYEAKQKKNKSSLVIKRYMLFFAHPKRLLENPLLSIGMLFMKTCEFAFGGIGYIYARLMI